MSAASLTIRHRNRVPRRRATNRENEMIAARLVAKVKVKANKAAGRTVCCVA